MVTRIEFTELMKNRSHLKGSFHHSSPLVRVGMIINETGASNGSVMCLGMRDKKWGQCSNRQQPPTFKPNFGTKISQPMNGLRIFSLDPKRSIPFGLNVPKRDLSMIQIEPFYISH